MTVSDDDDDDAVTAATDPTESVGASDPTESAAATNPTESAAATDPTGSAAASDPTESVGATDPAASADSAAGSGAPAPAPRRSWWPWAIGIGLLALLVRLPLLGSAVPGVDSPLYERIAGSLVRGDGFSTRGHVFGDAFRTPGYPLLLAFARILPGSSSAAAGTLQHLVGVAFAVGALLVGWRFFGRTTGVIAGLLVAIAPLEQFVEHGLYPDAAFSVALFLAVALIAESAIRDRPSIWLLIGIGLVAAAATYLKPNGLILVAVVPLTVLLARGGWRRAVRPTVVCAVTVAVALLPWIVHNATEDGTPLLTTQGGAALWVVAFDADRLPFSPENAQERLAVARSQRARAYKDRHGLPGLTYAQVFAVLRQHGATAADASSTMSALALRAIRQHPGTYLHGVGHVVRMEWQGTGNSRWGDVRLRQQLTRRPGGTVSDITATTSDVGDVVFSVWWWLTLGGLTGLATLLSPDRRVRTAGAAFVSASVLLAVGTALTNTVDVRYVAQLAPLAWTVGTAGTVVIAGWAAAAWRRRAPGGGRRRG